MPRRATIVLAALLLLLIAAGAGEGASAATPATFVSHGPRAGKAIALTFDDGSSPANCRRILAELLAQGVPATFFPIAEAMPLDPDLWRMVAAVGDPIGDHTMTHPQMPTMGYAAQLRQIRDARAMVESITGHDVLRVFRPPYGEFNRQTLAAAGAAGFPTVLTWDTSDRDTSPTGHLTSMLAAAELGSNGSVVLMHCGPNATPYLVPKIIDSYRGRGFRFVTVAELLGLSWDPGPLAPVTADQALGDLTPLPASSKGGAIVGIDGWTSPAPSVPPNGPASPSPSVSATPPAPSATPGPPSPTASAAATTTTPTLATKAGPAESPASAPASAADAVSSTTLLLLGGAIGALVLVLLGVAASRRRPR